MVHNLLGQKNKERDIPFKHATATSGFSGMSYSSIKKPPTPKPPAAPKMTPSVSNNGFTPLAGGTGANLPLINTNANLNTVVMKSLAGARTHENAKSFNTIGSKYLGQNSNLHQYMTGGQMLLKSMKGSQSGNHLSGVTVGGEKSY